MARDLPTVLHQHPDLVPLLVQPLPNRRPLSWTENVKLRRRGYGGLGREEVAGELTVLEGGVRETEAEFEAGSDVLWRRGAGVRV